WFHWFLAFIVGLGLMMVLFAWMRMTINQKRFQTSTLSKCRQIMASLTIWAQDHDGRYPEGPTANAAFRRLFVDEVVLYERPFSASASPFNCDNNLGQDTDYQFTLQPNENHWMMIAGKNAKSLAVEPVIFENALNATIPLRWDIKHAGQPVRGRTWKDGTIAVGFTDYSASLIQVSEPNNPLNQLPTDTKILDIETAP
ncbi:MAG: hypothetical protein KDK97_17715, partial [Verrucomicrobiales bacterium]|nr:hypothetical protein [Verrucomicrobiales bacterium]